MLCFGAQRKVEVYPKVGVIDDDGTMWHEAVVPGEFKTSLDKASDTCYATLVEAVKKFGPKECVGSRQVLTREKDEKGFEKVTLGPYSYLTYDQYYARVKNVGSGLAPRE